MDEVKRKILIAGDLAPLGRPQRLLAEGHVERTFGNTLPIIRTADCFVANLECPLTTSTEKQSKAGPNIKADPCVASALRKAGISVLSLANNHIFDYGLNGIEETTSVLEGNSIQWYGVGANADQAKAPLFVDLDGFRLGLLSYAEHEFNWQGDDRMCTSMLEPADNVLQIQEVAGQCDALITLLHAGQENWHYPSPRIVKICRAFARAGASAVLVAHAHAVMGFEFHHGVPILYGLGNFLYDRGHKATISWRLGMMVRLTFCGAGKVDIETIPVIANSETGCIDLLPENSVLHFQEFLCSLSSPLSCMNIIEGHWNAFCVSQLPHLTRECLKGLLAMLPGGFLFWLLRRRAVPEPESFYRKGANILRGLMVCENHQDVLGRICDLLKENRLSEYHSKAKELLRIADSWFPNM